MLRRALVVISIILLIAPAWAAEEGRKFALLISVQETRNPKLRCLWFCDDDINELKALLPKLGFPKENTTVLMQRNDRIPNPSNQQPTRSNIKSALKRLCKEAGPQDTVLIAFSGHGVQLKRDGRSYLCPPETVLTDTATLLPVDEVYKDIGLGCRAKTKILFIDACRLDPTDARPETIAHPPEPDPPPGVAVFLGCSKGQGSFETGKLMHGVFFHHIILGLNGAAYDTSGEVTTTSLQDYIAREVPKTTEYFREGLKVTQIPEFKGLPREPWVLTQMPAYSVPSVIHASDSTLAGPLHQMWADNYMKDYPSAKIEYRSGGFEGIKALASKTAHFAVTDAPLTPAELAAHPECLQFPSASTAVVPIYNLPSAPGIKLDGALLASIFMGKTQNWNDPAIKALNPSVIFPDQHIVAVYRSDSCGETRVYSEYLSSVSPEWKASIGSGTSVKFPVGAPAVGSADVARIAASVDGAIGYVELTLTERDALFSPQTQVTPAPPAQPPGTQPPTTPATPVTTVVPPKLAAAQLLPTGTSSDPYPIRGLTYVTLLKDLSYLRDRNTALEMMRYFRWCSTVGMKLARQTNTDMGAAQRSEVDSKLAMILFDGKPLLQKVNK